MTALNLEALIALRGRREDGVRAITMELARSVIYVLARPGEHPPEAGIRQGQDVIAIPLAGRQVVPIFTNPTVLTTAIAANPGWESLNVLEVGGADLIEAIGLGRGIVINPWSATEFCILPQSPTE